MCVTLFMYVLTKIQSLVVAGKVFHALFKDQLVRCKAYICCARRLAKSGQGGFGAETHLLRPRRQSIGRASAVVCPVSARISYEAICHTALEQMSVRLDTDRVSRARLNPEAMLANVPGADVTALTRANAMLEQAAW